MSGPDKSTLWNAVLAVIGVSLSGVLTLLYNKVDTLEQHQAEIQATLFTNDDGASIRSDLTIQFASIDKRLSLMDADSAWMQRWFDHIQPKANPGGVVHYPPAPESMDAAEPEMPPPVAQTYSPIPFNRANQSVQQRPAYDLRAEKK